MLLLMLTSMTRPLRAPVLLVALGALQLVPFACGAPTSASTPSESQLAAALLTPGAALPCESVDQERPDGGGASRPTPSGRHAPPSHEASAGSCFAVFCPWHAVDALARAGRASAPTTAPPGSPV